MKITNQSKRSPGRILLYALLASAGLAIGALPIYRALSQNKADASAQGSGQLNSLPTRLQINPDGSVRVSFQSKSGAVHQIYYADKLSTSANKAAWTLVADDIAAASGDWTDWLDASAATRSRPAGAQQGFYRVILKSAQAAKNITVTSATTSSIESTSTNAYAVLKAMRKRETAEILSIIAGGPENEAALAQKLAETPLTGEYVLELAKDLTEVEQRWARRLVLEAAVGPKAGALKVKQLARAHLALGSVYAATQRYPESIQHFLEAPRLEPTARQSCEGLVGAGRVYRLQNNSLEARRCWQQAIQFKDAGRWPEEAQWLIGLSYLEEGDTARALEEFKKLAEWPSGGELRAQGYYYMGEALRRLQRWDEAYAAYRKVMELNRNLPRTSPFRSQYNDMEKRARVAWAQIAPHLSTQSSSTPETNP